MHLTTLSTFAAGLLALSSLPIGVAGAEQEQTRNPKKVAASSADRHAVDTIMAAWPERPRLGAQMMLSQYGTPQEVTSEKLVWHNRGPYKRITVMKKEDHHDFPKPHMDFIEHTIHYHVPADKADAISAFDGSATFDRTRGELSGRCDLEGHNILTLNLAHDIAAGKKDAGEARKAFSQIVVEDMLGKNPGYVTALQFKPMTMTQAAFSDKPAIPGSPMRPVANAQLKGDRGDGEILGFIGAINENEIVAAMVASKKKVNSQLAQYATMLHQEHGKNLDQTMKLGQKIGVTPLETPAVDALRVKAAGELAALVPLDGEEFSRAYVTAMTKGHTEALQMIDTQLLPTAQSDGLKKHLTETRQHVAAHLEAAKKLQGGIAGTASDPTRVPVRQ
ncbi:MAG: DUF4142 domain-containing protein [Pseudomonadota bacterium]|nr:DUF4142 domain-containing protein [Pseudomonadota bacterium]